MEYIALALAPGIAICLYIFYTDVHNREPRLNLIVSFILGCLAIIPAIIFERAFNWTIDGSLVGVAIFSFAVVAFSEEFSKYLGLRLYAFPKKSFDEPLDGIVYSVMVSMGFATLENIFYVVSFAQYGRGLEVGLQRMFLSVPAHASFAVMMGYYVGKAKFEPAKRFRWMLTGVLLAVFFHGTYDFFLFIPRYSNMSYQVSEALLAACAIGSYIVCLILSRKLIRRHKLTSKQLFAVMKSMFTIRTTTTGDIELIRKLTYQVWPQTYSSLLSQEQIDYMLEMMYSPSSLQQQMEGGAQFVIINDGNEPVGFASYQEIKPATYKLHKLYVLPSQQGKGTGRYMIDHIIEEIKKKGATSLQLQVNRDNKAKTFYEKLGFTVLEEIKLDIGKGYFMDDYIMEKKL